MPSELRVPTLGESVVDATVGAWLKQEGETVAPGEALVELETDKVNVEVPAEQGGVLARIVKHEGDTVAIGDVLAVIDDVAAARPDADGQAPAASAAPEPSSAPAAEEAPPSPPPASGESQQAPAASGGAVDGSPGADQAAAPTVSPLARRVAAEHGVDVREVEGSGPHGRITKDDVIRHREGSDERPSAATAAAPPSDGPRAPAAPAPPSAAVRAPSPDRAAREQRVRMSRRRQTIARRLVEAQQTAAMLTTFNEIDMRAVMDVRKRRRDAFQERHGIGLGFMSFFTKAVVGALKAFPLLNAEIQGDEIVRKLYYDIGIAVAAEEGLVVPVVRDADRKSFAELERDIAELARRAREGTLSIAELEGGTFTITNGGVFGSLLSTPILNTPQVGILGMHTIQERPVVVAGEIVVRPMMYVALSYDHRIVDGSEAVRFLVRVKELVQDPESLLLEG